MNKKGPRHGGLFLFGGLGIFSAVFRIFWPSSNEKPQSSRARVLWSKRLKERGADFVARWTGKAMLPRIAQCLCQRHASLGMGRDAGEGIDLRFSCSLGEAARRQQHSIIAGGDCCF